MMDLSTAFDCLRHDLLIATLLAYGSSNDALSLIQTYLHQRQQRVRANGSFSSWKQLTIRVPQGSVFGPLLFNAYINNLLLSFSSSEVCNYTDEFVMLILIMLCYVARLEVD